MSKRTLRAFATAAWFNFMTFIAADLFLGGDAFNGKVENGRYFLNSHGRYTEVSHGIFVYSAAHAITAMLGICLVIFAAKRMKKTSN